MARVAVLGATGGVGRWVCAAFSRQGHEVLAVARRPVPGPAVSRFVPLDLVGAEPERLAGLFAAMRVDVVVNATGGWDPTVEGIRRTQLDVVQRLLAAFRLLAHRPRFVQIGTVHEYGPVPVGRRIGEDTPLCPGTPYARAKAAASQAILASTEAGEADGVVLRSVNVCGPHAGGGSFLGTVIAKLKEGGEVPAASIASDRRDFVDVRDLADAVVRASEAPVSGRVINIGRGEALPLRELVGYLFAAAGLPSDALGEQPGAAAGTTWTLVDIAPAEHLLDWRPRITLPDSLRAMWTAAAGQRAVKRTGSDVGTR